MFPPFCLTLPRNDRDVRIAHEAIVSGSKPNARQCRRLIVSSATARIRRALCSASTLRRTFLFRDAIVVRYRNDVFFDDLGCVGHSDGNRCRRRHRLFFDAAIEQRLVALAKVRSCRNRVAATPPRKKPSNKTQQTRDDPQGPRIGPQILHYTDRAPDRYSHLCRRLHRWCWRGCRRSRRRRRRTKSRKAASFQSDAVEALTSPPRPVLFWTRRC